MELEQRFALKLDHYYNKNTRAGIAIDELERVQPRGRQLKKLVKKIAGQILKQKIYLDVRPQDNEALEPEEAEGAKDVIQWHLYHPTLGYERVRALMVLQAVAARMSAVEVEYDPDIGPFGEIVFTWRDGRSTMWADGHETPHDPRCRWVCIALRMRRSAIEAMEGWKNTKDLRGDNGYLNGGRQSKNLANLDLGTSGDSPEVRDIDSENSDPYVTVVKMWERGVRDTVKREKPGSLVELAKADQYMKCVGCDDRSQTAGQSGETLDEFGVCKQCGSLTERQDAEVVDENVLAYRKGRRFTIFAPYEKREFVHLKKWPHDTSEIPLIAFQFDPYPGDPVGGSITFDHKTMQSASNMLLRIGLEQMRLAKPYVGMPTGAMDFRGQVWEFGDWQGLGIYFAPDTPLSERQIQMVQGSGLPNGWTQMDQSLDAKFQSNTGAADISLSSAQSKDIPASTIAQYVEQGDIPIDEATSRLRMDETPAMQALYEIIRDTYTPARWREFQGEDGAYHSALIAADHLPSINVVVTANPETARVELEELQAWSTFAQQPPAFREFFAKRLNVPISEVKHLEAAERAQMEKQQQTDHQELTRRAMAGDRKAMQLLNQGPQTNGGPATPASAPQGAGMMGR
jgi:hypothetical protein